MKVVLDNIGKRFNKDWIFKGINLELTPGDSYAVLGNNGSGKSTLLQVISGYATTSKGEIFYQKDETKIKPDGFYKYISIASPLLDLIEEFTLRETIDFYASFKSFDKHFDTKSYDEVFQLTNVKDKALKYYSSGMRQRVKLGLAILSNSPVLLLDEPTSNLDAKGIKWYNELITNHSNAEKRIILVASNENKDEYGFCKKEIRMEDYK